MLLFLTPASPLAQPRAVLLSQALAAAVGVACARLLPREPAWAAALAVAGAALLMAATKTVHPPAGATAVLAAADGGWEFVALVVAGSAVMVGVACVWTNLGGALLGGLRWPLWWWVQDAAVQDARAAADEVVLVVGADGVRAPEWLQLAPEERRVLEGVWARVRGCGKEADGCEKEAGGCGKEAGEPRHVEV